MSSARILVWFRRDLRLQDHEPLTEAARQGQVLIPFYGWEEAQWQSTPWGFPKTGAFRTQFLRETLMDLRRSLRQLGSDLVIRRGPIAQSIAQLVQDWDIDGVYYQAEVTWEEQQQEIALLKKLDALGVPCKRFWGLNLYHPDDLPFPVQETPELFTHFRQILEKKALCPRSPLPPPASLPPLPSLDPGVIPTLADFGLVEPQKDPRQVLNFIGGESAGLARLADYFWQKDALKTYKETRNGLLGADYSSKFSPWLALGCLSPRWVYQQVKIYEEKQVKNDSTYWLIFELLWRDFFGMMAAKHGSNLFQLSGLQGVIYPWRQDKADFEQWQKGLTGFPFVDANMRELQYTGFMSNRGRQNVASFLTKNLGIDWRWGAAWFESQLIDYDVCSNWGNWNYVAGVGNDRRGFRYFNLAKQSRDYDPKGDYLRQWLPELANIPGDKIHQPETWAIAEQNQWGVKLGRDYPKPMVNFWESLKQQEAWF